MDLVITNEALKNREPDFLEKAKCKVNGHDSYICPFCGNGRGSTGDGIALDPHSEPWHYKCFRCGKYEDIIGLWQAHTGTENYKDALESLYAYYGYHAKEEFKLENQKQYKSKPKTDENANIKYYEECMEHISLTDYPQKRGLSKEVISKFMLGFDSNYITGGKVWKALIIPTGSNSFVARNTDPKADKKDRYRKQGTSRLYNIRALKESEKPIFIVEGEIDALSIMSVGGNAVALGSTANYLQLLKILDTQKPAQPLIIALDNDTDGEKTTEKLVKEMELRGISFYRVNIYGDKKDANEALLADIESFTNSVLEAEKVEDEALAIQREEYLKTSVVSHLQEFLNGIADSVNTPYIPTGFKKLDRVLDGGLYEGLYIVGAISSLGKTTIVTQIADQVAQSGEDVLIFSLEMARSEIMAKSISRLTVLEALQNNGNLQYAKTTRGITTGKRYADYSEEEKELIQKATMSYGKYAKNIYILEGIGDIGVDKIKETVENHILFTGKKPVVILDYLQILSPYNERYTDKQNTDKEVMELKRISRDYKIPVIGISSFNRANYKEAVTMEAFKESGAIEYSSDVLIGLQLEGAGSKNFDTSEAKRQNPRKVELVILKNRNGQTGEKVGFNYYPQFNYFEEN